MGERDLLISHILMDIQFRYPRLVCLLIPVHPTSGKGQNPIKPRKNVGVLPRFLNKSRDVLCLGMICA